MSLASVTADTFITEREVAHIWVDGKTQDDGHYEDCVNCAIVMLVNCARPGAAPATHYEAEALRQAAGYGAFLGTNASHYVQAILDRYELTARAFSGTDDALITAVPVGYGAAIAGNPANFPYGHRLRRYLPDFNGGHQILILHLDTGWWWVDSMGPKDGAYHGEAVTEAEIRTFYTNGTNGGSVILPLAQESLSMVYEKIAQSGSFKVSSGKAAHALQMGDSGLAPTGAVAQSGSGQYDFVYHRVAGTNPPTYAMHVSSGLFIGFFISSAEIDEVPNVVPAPITQAQVDAAVLAAKQAQYDADSKSIVASAAVTSTKLSNPRPS